MDKNILLRTIVTWLLFLPVPVINGLLREKWYKPLVGELAAHWIGTIIVSFVFTVYAYVSLGGRLGEITGGQLWAIGCIWLVLTIAFEFGLGLATGRSISFILSDYNIFAGRIWPLVPLVTLLAPNIVKWIK